MDIGSRNIEVEAANGNRGFHGGDPVFTDEVEAVDPPESDAAALREELASERDARLRLAAEYENYRRRTKRDSVKAADEGKRELLEKMLSIADDLDLALANLDESTGVVADGVRLIHRRFHDLLDTTGVAAFESRGKMFDPEIHEAFDVANGTGDEPGTVHEKIAAATSGMTDCCVRRLSWSRNRSSRIQAGAGSNTAAERSGRRPDVRHFFPRWDDE